MQALDGVGGVGAVGIKQILVERDELKESLRSSVAITPLLQQVVLCSFLDASERDGHEFDDSLRRGRLSQVELAQEAVGDAKQSRLRPRLEPINDSAVHNGQEALRSDAELLTHWRVREAHVKILPGIRDEEIPAVVARVDQSRRLNLTTDGVDNLVRVLGRKKLRHLAASKQVVDRNEELLVRDLSVRKEPADALALQS